MEAIISTLAATFAAFVMPELSKLTAWMSSTPRRKAVLRLLSASSAAAAVVLPKLCDGTLTETDINGLAKLALQAAVAWTLAHCTHRTASAARP